MCLREMEGPKGQGGNAAFTAGYHGVQGPLIGGKSGEKKI